MSYNLTNAVQGGNITFCKAGLGGLSGAASTFTTTASGGLSGILYSNGGKAYYKANFGATATPTNDAASTTAVVGTAASGAAFRPLVAQQAPAGLSAIYTGSACVFVFGLDPAGNIRVAQGRVVNYTDTSANSTVTPLPSLPDWFTPFGYAVITLVSATAATWTFGTNNWNATGITVNTPVDVSLLPPTDPLTA